MIMMGSVGFIALLGVRKVDSVKNLGLNMSVIVTADSRSLNTNAQLCCINHPEWGACWPGVDDATDGRCWRRCIGGCEKGGFCKRVGRKHVCHCYC
ncbi:putative defensin-like protein 20 [Cucumis melo var. makuwa]|uniref:Putative defensin-like protein 20 n=1 Tax=Cucumis melo var. makuwa TaxID=1194695 RepID=A0A5D3CG20_CUCMM|nr:putative defensin-like protein 20 [Cucumis melo var. makuwa]